jgi:hypothetical protein
MNPVNVGDTFTSRTGAKYTVTETRPNGFTITRTSGKTVRISARKVQQTAARLQAGERLAFQRNPKDGGISYTVAVEAGVVYALRDMLTRDDDARCYLVKR